MTVAAVKNRVHIPNFRDGKWKKMGNRADIRRLNRQVWNIVLADETATNFQKAALIQDQARASFLTHNHNHQSIK